MSASGPSSAVAAAAVGAAALAALGALALSRAGAFRPVELDSRPLVLPRHVAFKAFREAYRHTGSRCAALGQALDATGHSGCADSLILAYFDDPQGPEGPGRTRYLIGVPVTPADPPSALEHTLRGMGFTLIDCGEQAVPAIHAGFPFTGALSVLMALWRVYPRGFREMENRGLKPGPVVEHTHWRRGHTDFYFFTDQTLPEPLWKAVQGV